MKATIFKYRFVIGTICILAIYGLTTHDYILRHLHRFITPVFLTMIPILLASSFCVYDKPFWLRLVWTIFMPVAASFLGFISMNIWFYLSDQGNPFNISFINWLAVNLAGPHSTAKVYKISIMLSMLCLVDQLIIRIRKTREQESVR